MLLLFFNKSYNAYLDNILIWLYNNYNNYIIIMKKYFTYLREANLFINIKKYKFLVTRILFLGYILIPEGFKMDPEKVRVILEWPIPRTLKDL